MDGKGIDIGRKLSFEEIDLLHSRGYRFVARYYDGSKGTSPKALDTVEIAKLFSLRFAIVPVFETDSRNPAYYTYDQGVADGNAARSDALAIGQPLGTPIAFAVDADVDPSALLDYLNGAFIGLEALYLLGVYGSYKVVKYADENYPAVGFLWQTYAWSGGLYYPASNVYQHANGVPITPTFVVDKNIATTDIPWRLAS